MAYSNFSLAQVKSSFGLTLDESRSLFTDTKPILPLETLKTLLIDYIPLATSISTEKARSEFLIAPVLAEVRKILNNQISLFSGNEFNVDPQSGLIGFCDYIISSSPEQLFITDPVVIIALRKYVRTSDESSIYTFSDRFKLLKPLFHPSF